MPIGMLYPGSGNLKNRKKLRCLLRRHLNWKICRCTKKTCSISRRQVDAHRHAISRQRKSQEQQQTRRQIDAERHAISRQQESQENRQIRLLRSRSRQRELRFQPFTRRQWKQSAFHYDPKHDYAAEEVITIGSMSKVCNYCRAKK